MEQVVGLAVRERGRPVGHRRDALPDPEDNHLAQRVAARDQIGGVAEEGVDRTVVEFGQVLPRA